LKFPVQLVIITILISLMIFGGGQLCMAEQESFEYPANKSVLKTIINSKSSPDSVRLKALNDYGWQLRNSHTDSALTYLSQALDLAIQTNLSNEEVNILNRIGVIHRNRGSKIKAFESFSTALAKSELIGNEREVGYSYMNLAHAYLDDEAPFLAITNATKGKEIFQKTGNILGEAYANGIIGEAYLKLKNNRNAINFLTIAYKIRKDQGVKESQAISATFLATAHSSIGDNDIANQYLTEALDIFHSTNHFFGLNLAYLAKASMEMNTNMLDEAENSLHIALDNAKKLGAELQQLQVYQQLAVLKAKKASFDSAYYYQVVIDSITREKFRRENIAQYDKLKLEINQSQSNRENRLLLQDQLQKQQDLRKKNQQIYILFILIGLLLFLIALFIKNQLKIKKQNAQLTEINVSMELQQQEILDQKEKLTRQSEEIMLKNIALESINEEKDNLMGIVAHDLRTPLANIDGLGHLIKEAGELNEEQNKYLKIVQSVSRESIKLINDLLVLTRIESGTYEKTKEKIAVGELVQAIIQANRPVAQAKDIKLELSEDYKKDGILKTDSPALRRIIENLISNAIKFSYPNTIVRLSVTEEPFYYEFIVKDEGPGISEEDQKKLFKKFTKLANKPTSGESSSGLGLSIVKGLTEQLKGEIRIESALGVGSTFHLIIPK
jgi:signal transduction histidine kinase